MHTIDTVLQDVRYAWRSILRTPGFTIMVVTTLTLGIGVNAAMFGFLDRIFLRPPSGVQDPETLRRLWAHHSSSVFQNFTIQSLAYPKYVALRDEAATAGAKLALFMTSDGMRIGRNREAPPVHGVYATANYFDVLGVHALRGRLFAPDEDVMGAGKDVVVVNEGFWKTRLNGDPDIIGKQIQLALVPYTVIGIVPTEFVGTEIQSADIWMPFGSFRGRPPRDGKQWYESLTTYGARALMRVPANFNDAAFGARATVLAQRIENELDVRSPDKVTMEAGSIIAALGPGELTAETRVATRAMGVALIVLLIAIANVVNLLLARAARRRQEIAVRLALGVSRLRLVATLTTESVMLAFVAGGAAVLTAWWGAGMLRGLLLPDIEWIDSGLDGRVVVFSLAVALIAGLVSGIIPALQASNPQLASALKSGARDGFVSRSRLRTGLVGLQAAFSVVLLVGAALFLRSLRNVEGIDIGYDIGQTVMAELLFESGEAPSDAMLHAAVGEIAARIAVRPGVEKVGRSGISPMRGWGMSMYYADQTTPATSYNSNLGPVMSRVSPGFFEASGLRLLRGRVLGGNEYATPGTAPNEVVANQIAAQMFYPGEDPLGKCIRFGKRENPCHTIVGIVEDANTRGVIEGKMGHFYVALGSAAAGDEVGSAIVVRARHDAVAAVGNELRREIKRTFPLAHPFIISMNETLAADYRPYRIGATLFTTFSALALLVALVGIYSSVSYMVGQRTREFGVRIALGAHTRDVLNQVLEEGLRVVAGGVAAGIVLALLGGRLVQSLLFGVEATDVSAMLLAACSLLAMGAVAGLVPAWRAARVDPVVALRAE